MESPTGTYCSIVIPVSSFRSVPFSWFLSELEDIRKACKTLVGYRYDNSHYRIRSISGQEYSFMFVKAPFVTNKFSINVWDARGGANILDEPFCPDSQGKIPIEIVLQIEKMIGMWEKGEALCCDCESKIKYPQDVAGRYFAGFYCASCWLGNTGRYKGKGGWKLVEARETYN